MVVSGSLCRNSGAASRAKVLSKKNGVHVSVFSSRYRLITIFVGRCRTSTTLPLSSECISSVQNLFQILKIALCAPPMAVATRAFGFFLAHQQLFKFLIGLNEFVEILHT